MRSFSLFSLLLLLTSYIGAQSVDEQLQQALDEIYRDTPGSIGILAHVESAQHQISWSGASGFSSKDTRQKLEADQPFLIASSIKTYVSAAILRLVEEELLSIDDPIKDLISERSSKLFIKDGYNLDSIKVKHLLTHTGGVWNYANQEYIDHKDANPNFRWTRELQLERTVNEGDPLGEPGTIFQYSDANYLLLGEILETFTDLPFYDAIPSLLKFDNLGIKSTWFPTLQDKPAHTNELVHQYWGSYGWDSQELDISWDLYGGGGIACTSQDLAKLVLHYFEGDIVKDDSVRNLIYTELPTAATELTPYYLGLTPGNYDGHLGFGHGGFWSTVMMYIPSLETSISVCILERDHRAISQDVITTLSSIVSENFLDQEQTAQELVNYLERVEDFSGTIAIAHDQELLLEKAYGLANIEHAVLNRPDTKFNLASISKLITAVAVLQLVDQGKIDLSASVGTYLTDYPNPVIRDSATIEHLLTHKSGIPPFYGRAYLSSDKLQYKSVSDFVPLFVNDSLNFHPGQQYQYGGAGFVLLGRVIEELTGMDYYDCLDQEIFRKARMANTLAIPTDSIVSNMADGYTRLWGDQGHLSRNDHYTSLASPAGGHYSTARDLYYFARALGDGTLLSQESYQLLTSPKVRGYNTLLGYGIDIDRRYDEEIIGHSGGWFGVRTELMHFRGSDYYVIVLSNQDDDGKSGASKVIEDIKTIIAGKKRS